MSEESGAGEVTGDDNGRTERLDVDAIVAQVQRYLRLKDESARHDVYVWSDGRVTPFEPEHSEGGAHLVSTFTPGEDALRDAQIRESIVRGLRTVPGEP